MPRLKHSLIGQTVDVKIKNINYDYYDCELINDRQNSSRKWRLYFNCTKEWKHTNDLSGNYSGSYRNGTELKVLVVAARKYFNLEELVLYLHERRANENISEAKLNIGDEVFGWVIREVPELGWIVQLDYSRDLLNNPSIRQPDVVVLAKKIDLPNHQDGLKYPLELEPGDPVIGIVNEVADDIHKDDRISLRAGLAALDSRLIKQGKQASARALWHWHSMVNSKKEFDPDSNTLTPQYSPIFSDYSILMVEDDQLTLSMRAGRLRDNGAEVYELHAQPNLIIRKVVNSIQQMIDDNSFDLILLDYACPSTERGISIANQTIQYLESLNLKVPVALCGAVIRESDQSDIIKKLPKICGILTRPIRIPSIISLLLGEKKFDQTVNLPPLNNETKDTFGGWLKKLYLRENLKGLAIGHQVSRQSVEWLHTNGSFSNLHRANLSNLYRTSSFRKLLDSDDASLTCDPTDNTKRNNFLFPSNEFVFWWKIKRADQVWLVAVSSKSPFPSASLLQDCINNGLHFHNLQQKLTFHAELLSSGLLLQALTHEFYNRIAALRSQANLLEEMSKNPPNLEILKSLSNDNRYDANELEELIDSIMHGFAQRKKPTQLIKLFKRVERTSKLLESQFGHIIYLAPPPPLAIYIPEGVITLALINLMHNTGKHGNRDQGLQQRIYWDLKLSDEQEPLALQIIAEDNGLGISSFQVNNLFTLGVSYAAKDEERHGLGLWLSRMLLERCEADLSLEDNIVGQGCRFVIEIPLTLEGLS